MKNLRFLKSPKSESEYFEYRRGFPKGARVDSNPHWVKLKNQIDSGYFDVSICFWGAVGRLTKPDSSAPGNVFYIKYKHPICEHIFKNFDVSRINAVSAGASQITHDDLVRIFDEMFSEINASKTHSNLKIEN